MKKKKEKRNKLCQKSKITVKQTKLINPKVRILYLLADFDIFYCMFDCKNIP